MSHEHHTVSVNKVKELPFLLRVLWFFFLGWEITGIWILVAWFLNLTVIGLPVGLWMINRVPQVLTLKARPGAYASTDGGPKQYLKGKQRPLLIRAIYFVLIGWWFSLFWAAAGWLLCLTIIGIPVGVLMLNRMPNVTTLQRG